ncbi:hypothetical protein DRH13_02275 [Candidatus Woesebacteria bacterium]|nr:MAG: hypothetical protein DRH13_02275 [Candidatus Woesebacteria bacterium]
MPMIVTRQQAMDHLRIDDATDEADDLDLKILAASAVILDYIERDSEDYEVDDSDSSNDSDSSSDDSSSGDAGGSSEYDWPYQVQAAVLLLVGDLHRHRDSEMPKYSEATLPPAVRALIYPLKSFGLDI